MDCAVTREPWLGPVMCKDVGLHNNTHGHDALLSCLEPTRRVYVFIMVDRENVRS